MTTLQNYECACIQLLIESNPKILTWRTQSVFDSSKKALEALRGFPLDEDVRALLGDSEAAQIGHLTIDFLNS